MSGLGGMWLTFEKPCTHTHTHIQIHRGDLLLAEYLSTPILLCTLYFPFLLHSPTFAASIFHSLRQNSLVSSQSELLPLKSSSYYSGAGDGYFHPLISKSADWRKRGKNAGRLPPLWWNVSTKGGVKLWSAGSHARIPAVPSSVRVCEYLFLCLFSAPFDCNLRLPAIIFHLTLKLKRQAHNVQVKVVALKQIFLVIM